MAISIRELFSEFNLELNDPVKWNDKFEAKFNGIYVIALTNNPDIKEAHNYPFKIDQKTFENWRKEATELEIDGKKVKSIKQVEDYLKQFWIIDENILYIGESSSKTNPLEKRINQFYIHKVGKKGPHSGGYWLKLISYLNDVHIFYAEAENPRETEFKMIMKFVELRTGKSFYEVNNFSNYFPFANLKVDVLKQHSIKKNTNKNTKKKQ